MKIQKKQKIKNYLFKLNKTKTLIYNKRENNHK